MLCGSKELGLIFFKKIIVFILLFFFLSIFYNYTFMSNIFFQLRSLKIFMGGTCRIDFLFSLDKNFIFFFFIVRIVVAIVSSYREFYIKDYNVKKFILLIYMFFFIIIFLISRESGLVLLIGWDFLGLVSIYLIFFYPNKISLFNGSLTLFYNRLGDCFLLIFLCLITFNYTKRFALSNSLIILLLLLLCSFTKRAQFPTSAWLPAAMSAPTPISAIVHSSTLVTAGIYLNSNIINLYRRWRILTLLFYLSLISIFIAGIFATVELDLKKIIAFSTIRQISLVIFFFRNFFVITGVCHILIHAVFKSTLFCLRGVIFINSFSRQSTKKIFNIKFSEFYTFIFIFCLFAIRGLSGSVSSFTKHRALEYLMLDVITFRIFFFMLTSVLTLFYSSKILKVLLKNFTKFSSSSFNKWYLALLNVYIILIPFLFVFLKRFFFFDMEGSFSSIDSVALFALILTPAIFKIMFFARKNIYFLNQNIFLSKLFIYSSLGILPKLMWLNYSDNLFLKFSYSINKKIIFSKSSIIFLFIFFILSLL